MTTDLTPQEALAEIRQYLGERKWSGSAMRADLDDILARVKQPEPLEETAKRITRDWLRHTGMSEGEIEEGETERDHRDCEFIADFGWDCIDEYGQSRHPHQDATDSASEQVVFVLERALPQGK